MTRLRQMTRARRTAVSAVVVAVLAVATAGYMVASALAAPAAPGAATSRLAASSSANRVPPPVFVNHPPSQTESGSAVFTFTDADSPNVTFHCYLDGPPASTCNSGRKVYSGLPVGYYCFYVWVTNHTGFASPVSYYCWWIIRPHPFPPPGLHHHHHHQNKNFTVGGNLTTPLLPGVSESLDMTFTNPNSAPLTIAAGGISSSNIAITTNQSGCGSENFAVTQGLTVSVTIPAHATNVSLSALHVPEADWPVITMLDLSTNQDACSGATLTLTYSGIEAS